ncbi:acyl-CoA dehydrogenase [Dactylosporangium vinaceum]|uniref:Acyl-CoA dehydrogenase family protein n=1 Tax=Dactylosporangium vinaceum TaxID=53362 RepID=A0ABV5MRN4_9ACTN|nr:acyl-CoA dehydrogenase family protein [Dactylosporangium vinaceum]
MHFAPTDEQLALADAVRAPLAAGDWEALAEIGVFAAFTELGLAETDLVGVLEAAGYAAIAEPFSATAFVAAPLLAAIGDARGTDGSRIALAGPHGLAPFGAKADWILHLDERTARLGAAAGASVSAVDNSLSLAYSTGADMLTDDVALVRIAHLRAGIALAAELVGVGRRMLDLTVAYVKQRRQFGVPVGSFQAVKHQLADVLLGLEFAGPEVLAAAWAVEHDRAARHAVHAHPTADARHAVHAHPTAAARQTGHSRPTADARQAADDTWHGGGGRPGVDAQQAVDAAVVLAAEASHRAGRVAVQCHGAIGYTVEYELHRYLKRGWALEALADTGRRLDRLAASLDLPGERP